MLTAVGSGSMEEFLSTVVPDAIRTRTPLRLPPPVEEHALLAELRGIASENIVARSLLGMGYASTITPTVILRNILENPGWYTAYTPYQAEIAQGRLEALLNFQTMVIDMTGLPIANASLLDEGTAAAEALVMFAAAKGHPSGASFFVDERCHPQTIAVVRTRSRFLGIEVTVGDHRTLQPTLPSSARSSSTRPPTAR
jgi:glycine dehydrogenase